MDDLAKDIVWRWSLQCCHWTFCGNWRSRGQWKKGCSLGALSLNWSFSYWNSGGGWDRHQYWTSGNFWSTVLCGGHRKMSQMRHILRRLGRIIFLLEKREKSTFWLLRGTDPCRTHPPQARSVGKGCSLGSWEQGPAHLGHVLCKHPLVLCSAVSLLGKWFVSFSLLFISILKHLRFLRERSEEAAACFCGWVKLRMLFFLYLILGEQ